MNAVQADLPLGLAQLSCKVAMHDCARICRTLVAYLLSGLFLLAGDYSRGDEDGLIGQVAGVRSPLELNDIYVRLFGGPDDSDFRKFQSHKHDGIAIQAAWEDVRSTIPIPTRAARDERPPRLDEAAAHRFIGFLNGRLRVQTPVWWEQLLVNSRAAANASGNVDFWIQPTRGVSFYNSVSFPNNDTKGVQTPSHVEVSALKADTLTLTCKSTQLVAQLSEATASDLWGVNASRIDDNRFVVVAHRAIAAGADLTCIDSQKQTELWRGRIWGECPRYARQGDGFFHWIDIRTNDESVVVFGALADVLYVEGFRLKDGSSLFRFSSTYPWKNRQ